MILSRSTFYNDDDDDDDADSNSELTRGKSICPTDGSRTGAYRWCRLQPLSECFWSGAGHAFVAVSATSDGHSATLISVFDF